MMNTAARVMFEIYREAGYGRKYRAVYFTELDEHNKEAEISRAMAGEHLYDGFLSERQIREAKSAVQAILDRLNAGESLDEQQIEQTLAPFAA
jgi:DNA-binding transcriptional regulator YbjK